MNPATQTFYWHDYETFGRDPQRDRAAQFAGLRTDMDFNVIGDPLLLYCKPAADMLPEPEACLITGITPQHAASHGVNEAEFIRQIHAEMAQPNTCTIGYNNLRFDDEFTRNLLYRNFYDAYAREWQNGNSRWDIIDMVRMCYALRPDGIHWPEREAGVPSFKLEDLTAANGIEHGAAAHDALADVKATIALAKLIRDKHPKLYTYLETHRHKAKASAFLDVFNPKPVLHTTRMYSAEIGCTSLILPLAVHPSNKNAVIVYDLRSPPDDLIDLDVDKLAERIFTAKDKLPEGQSRIPIKLIQINKCPVLAEARVLREKDAARIKLDVAQCEIHAAQIQQAQGLTQKLHALYDNPDYTPHSDPDLMIYSGGFFSGHDKRQMATIREQSPHALAQLHCNFNDKRLPEMFFRYRARNYPESLSVTEQETWVNYCKKRLLTEDGGSSLTYATYCARLDALEATASEQQQKVLTDLRNYGVKHPFLT